MKDGEFTEQFKTVEDLKAAIDSLIAAHRDAKNGRPLGVMFRVVVPPNATTTYVEGHQGPYQLVEGVRICDYKFEKSTGLEYVLPDPTSGLSFSKSFSHLKNTRKMLSRHAKGYKQPGPANVAWWILSKCDMPSGLAFLQDPKDSNHYFLAATERMHVSALVRKLKLISFHMTTMKDGMQ